VRTTSGLDVHLHVELGDDLEQTHNRLVS
jgi:hypothetical protein